MKLSQQLSWFGFIAPEKSLRAKRTMQRFRANRWSRLTQRSISIQSSIYIHTKKGLLRMLIKEWRCRDLANK
jgi:hypothetical protein